MSASTDSSASLAAQIQRERLRQGLTQLEVARRSGVAINTYWRFERGGPITLQRFEAIARTLGVQFVIQSTATPATLTDPRLTHTRRRGLRRARTAPAPAPSSADATSPTAARRTTRTAPPPKRKPPVDAAAAAAMMKRYGDKIRFLVRTIVSNRLTNYTTRTVVQNTMASNRVADTDRPAFVAAVENELAALTAENRTALGIRLADYEAWSATWDGSLGIVDALE